MSTVKVVGIGSPYGADRLGWDVIGLLKKETTLRSLMPHQLSLIWCDRPGVELINIIEGSQIAILIDAVKSQQPPGTVIRLEKSCWKDTGEALSTHAIGILQSLALGEVLQMLPQVIIFGLTIGDNDKIVKPRQLLSLKNAILNEINTRSKILHASRVANN